MKIGPVDLNLRHDSEQAVQDALDDIIAFSERRQEGEFKMFDFKRQLNHSTKLRKMFTCFANADGGLVVVGAEIEEEGTISWYGIEPDRQPDEQQLENYLTDPNHISEPPPFEPLRLEYQGVPIVLYQIYPSTYPIEIKKGGDWVTYRRVNESCEQLSPLELQLELAGHEEWSRDSTVDDVSTLSFHRVDGTTASQTTISIDDVGQHQSWFEIAVTGHPVFVPVPVLPFHPDNPIYMTQTRRVFTAPEFSRAIRELEQQISRQHGLEHEVWSIDEEVTLESGVYNIGSGATHLDDAASSAVEQSDSVDFAWVLFTGTVVYTVVGRFKEGHWYVTIRRDISFIPNHFPFVTLDEKGTASSTPLSVTEDSVSHGENWVSPNTVTGEDPSEAALRGLPAAEIDGYLGVPPRERGFKTPFRQRTGSVVLSRTGDQTGLGGKKFPAFIQDMEPLVASVDQAPHGFNDQEEARITSMIVSGRAKSFTPGGGAVVLFNVSLALQQEQKHRFPEPDNWEMS